MWASNRIVFFMALISLLNVGRKIAVYHCFFDGGDVFRSWLIIGVEKYDF